MKSKKPKPKKYEDNRFAVQYKSPNKVVHETFYRLVDAILFWIRNAPDHALIIVDGIRIDPKGRWMEFKQAIERFDREQDAIVQAVKRFNKRGV